MKPEHGIVYVAVGAKHFGEALESIKTVRAHMPEISITVFTDAPNSAPNPLINEIRVIDQVQKTFSVKILPLLQTPYQKTLYLDTDTYLCQSCAELFPLLDKFDLLVAHDPWRNSYKFETVPTAFGAFNTGVIAYRMTDATRAFITEWERLHREHYGKLHSNDQPAFRHVLYESQLRFLVLTPEYNLRTYHPVVIGGHGRPFILHERSPYVPETARRLMTFQAYKSRPFIYGHISPRLLFAHYFTKVRRVAHRWLFKS